ncbi:MAG: hypothetical protein ACLPVY_22840 [Acidimicrobiia bacterium]
MDISCAFCGERVEIPDRCSPWRYLRRDTGPNDAASMLMIGDDRPCGGVRLLHQCWIAAPVNAPSAAGERPVGHTGLAK